jgi:ADP-ribose pyrophosphatase
MNAKHQIQPLLHTQRFTVVEHQVTQPDGSVATCAAVEHPGAVVILPILPEGKICLIRNHRLTVGATILELPAGTREENETPLETAKRELAEETGYRGNHFEKLAEFFTSPGIVNECMHAFVATDLTAGSPAREANEEIENYIVTWDEALEMVAQGTIQDGKTLVTLLLYERQLHRPA